MNNIKIIKGNLFTSKSQTIVNTVNTVGVMGAGVALEFKLRYPDMYEKYVELCKAGEIHIGKLWIYKTEQRWILNFPTKMDWKDDSKIEYLEKGLEKFLLTYKQKGITSIAFPLLGARNGRIPQAESLKIMKGYLEKCDIPIEIYKYDPNAEDELYSKLYSLMKSWTVLDFYEKLGIQKTYSEKIINAFREDKVKNIGKLISIPGVGIKTMQKLLSYTEPVQK